MAKSMTTPKEAAAASTVTKKKRFLFLKRLMNREAWRWRSLSSGLQWKRLNFHLSFFDDILFKIVSVFEAIFLVSTLCFFYCFCGCNF